MHPVLFEFGPLTIRSYGVIVAVAFLVTYALMYERAKRANFYPQRILDLELIVLIFGIIGARALHVMVNLDFYSGTPLDIFLVWRGGLAFLGGFILAIVAAWIYIKKTGMPLLRTADFVAPYMALGHAIGRIGCLLNGCCFGKLATGPGPVVLFPGEIIPRYPTQVYSSAALLFIFIILKSIEGKKPFAGFVFASYVMLYCFQRFLIDFLRGDNPTYLFDLTVSQWIAGSVFLIAVIAVSVAAFFRIRRRKKSQ